MVSDGTHGEPILDCKFVYSNGTVSARGCMGLMYDRTLEVRQQMLVTNKQDSS